MSPLFGFFLGVLSVVFSLFFVAWMLIWRGLRHSKTHVTADGTRKDVQSLIAALKQVLKRLVDALRFTWFGFRVWVLWQAKKPRRWIHLLLVGIFICCGVVSLLEIMKRVNFGIWSWILYLLSVFLSASGDYASSNFVCGFDDWFDRTIQTVPVNISLLVVEILLVFRHISEFKEPEDPNFWESFQLLLIRANGLRNQMYQIDSGSAVGATEKESGKQKLLEGFLDGVSKAFRDSFAIRKIGGICVSIMEERESNSGPELTYIFVNNGEIGEGAVIRDKFDSDFKLPSGRGAAGVALQKKCVVYIPSIRTGYAALIQERALWDESGFELARDIYVHSRIEPFKSMICVPIPRGEEKAIAVLTLSCERANAFGPRDFKMAWRAALVVSLGMNP